MRPGLSVRDDSRSSYPANPKPTVGCLLLLKEKRSAPLHQVPAPVPDMQRKAGPQISASPDIPETPSAGRAASWNQSKLRCGCGKLPEVMRKGRGLHMHDCLPPMTPVGSSDSPGAWLCRGGGVDLRKSSTVEQQAQAERCRGGRALCGIPTW